MQRLITTNDGSHSLFNTHWNVSYHSQHGAIAESRHIYIEAGLQHVLSRHRHVAVFEMGLGTALNALLTLLVAEEIQRPIYYETVENSPVDLELARQLNYCEELKRPDLKELFLHLHDCPWEEPVTITSNFTFHKRKGDISRLKLNSLFDVVYFDPFDPATQPELWTSGQFLAIREHLHPNGILVTYSSKSIVRKHLESAGFSVQKLPGPTGKREITRAIAL